MTVDIVIPLTTDDPQRLDNYDHVLTRLRSAVPEFRVLTGSREPIEPWSKAVAVDRIIREESTADIVVIHDADVICTEGLWQAIGAVMSGAGWAMPHGNVGRLDKDSTEKFKRPSAHPDSRFTFTDKPYRGHPGGGISVLTRALWDRCPLDPRFHGWGQEDDSWAFALNLIAGRPYRAEQPLIHLWHEPLPRTTRRHGSEATQELWRRYYRARHNPNDMRTLLDEASAILQRMADGDPDPYALPEPTA